MDKKEPLNISDSLMIGYDQQGDDLPVLTIGRVVSGDKIELVRLLGGESAVDMYHILLDYGNKSGKSNMLMPKNIGRSMAKRNLEDMVDGIGQAYYRTLLERGDV